MIIELMLSCILQKEQNKCRCPITLSAVDGISRECVLLSSIPRQRNILEKY